MGTCYPARSVDLYYVWNEEPIKDNDGLIHAACSYVEIIAQLYKAGHENIYSYPLARSYEQ